MNNDFTAKRGRGRPPKNGAIKGATPHTFAGARAELPPPADPAPEDGLDGIGGWREQDGLPVAYEEAVEENRPATQAPEQAAPQIPLPETIAEQLSRVSAEVRALEDLIADKRGHQSWLLSRMAEQGPPNTAQDHAEQARRISQAIAEDGFGRERKSATRRRFMGQQK